MAAYVELMYFVDCYKCEQDTRAHKKDLNFGEPRRVEKGELCYYCFLAVGQKGSIKAAVFWYQW